MESNSHALEADPRFPSGPWVGFFLDARMPGKHSMELALTFSLGRMIGRGRDRVGEFTVDGHYDVADGRCEWLKQYLGKHHLCYRGFNEGKGIWGTWELTDHGFSANGGFHIWPEGMPDPSQPRMAEEADPPIEYVDEPSPPILVPAGSDGKQ